MAEYVVDEPSDRSASWRVHERIVRCRDCEYATSDGCGCTLFGRREQRASYRWEDVPAEVEPDGFCSWASRKESE